MKLSFGADFDLLFFEGDDLLFLGFFEYFVSSAAADVGPAPPAGRRTLPPS